MTGTTDLSSVWTSLISGKLVEIESMVIWDDLGMSGIGVVDFYCSRLVACKPALCQKGKGKGN